jgi:hypothetical protein
LRLAKWLMLGLLLGCSKRETFAAEPLAVGTWVGGGSMLFGPSSCTYDAPPSVAELSTNTEGKAFMARLVGEGSITETCRHGLTHFRVRRATALRIDGPGTLRVGPNEGVNDGFGVMPLAQSEALLGVRQGGEAPEWSLGEDCAGVAHFGPLLGSSDTGGPSIRRWLVGERPGSCTLRASVLGVSASRVVVIQPARMVGPSTNEATVK